MIPIERTGEYRGLYHVLGGALSPIDGVDPEDLRIAELIDRVNGEVKEVVLATNPTTTGEATALHIADALRDRVTVTRLASGLPVGADLEHADEVTLGKALAGRQPWVSLATCGGSGRRTRRGAVGLVLVLGRAALLDQPVRAARAPGRPAGDHQDQPTVWMLITSLVTLIA